MLGRLTVPGLLGVAFVVLKLTDVIAWSWLWVTTTNIVCSSA